MALQVNGITGDYAEFGCHTGGSFQAAYHSIAEITPERHVWAFDSLVGVRRANGWPSASSSPTTRSGTSPATGTSTGRDSRSSSSALVRPCLSQHLEAVRREIERVAPGLGTDVAPRYAIASWFVAPSVYPEQHVPIVL